MVLIVLLLHHVQPHSGVGAMLDIHYHGFHHMAIHLEARWACSMNRITATSSGSMANPIARLTV